MNTSRLATIITDYAAKAPAAPVLIRIRRRIPDRRCRDGFRLQVEYAQVTSADTANGVTTITVEPQ